MSNDNTQVSIAEGTALSGLGAQLLKGTSGFTFKNGDTVEFKHVVQYVNDLLDKNTGLQGNIDQCDEMIKTVNSGRPIGDIVGIHAAQNAMRKLQCMEIYLTDIIDLLSQAPQFFAPDTLEAEKKNWQWQVDRVMKLSSNEAKNQLVEMFTNQCLDHVYKRINVDERVDRDFLIKVITEVSQQFLRSLG